VDQEGVDFGDGMSVLLSGTDFVDSGWGLADVFRRASSGCVEVYTLHVTVLGRVFSSMAGVAFQDEGFLFVMIGHHSHDTLYVWSVSLVIGRKAVYPFYIL